MLTAEQRLQFIRKDSGKTQSQMAAIMKLSSQSTYSRKENGNRPITAKEANYIEEELGYRAEWLLYRKGEIRADGVKVQQESSVTRAATINQLDGDGMRLRFIRQIEAWRKEHNKNLAETAEVMDIAPQNLNNVIHGSKGVSRSMVMNCCRFGKFNANYTFVNLGDLFIDAKLNAGIVKAVVKETEAEVSGLKRRVKELEELVSMQRMVIDQFGSNSVRQKKSA